MGDGKTASGCLENASTEQESVTKEPCEHPDEATAKDGVLCFEKYKIQLKNVDRYATVKVGARRLDVSMINLQTLKTFLTSFDLTAAKIKVLRGIAFVNFR